MLDAMLRAGLRRSRSGSLAMFTAIRRASSSLFKRLLPADRRVARSATLQPPCLLRRSRLE
jgi:hypothetical protein